MAKEDDKAPPPPPLPAPTDYFKGEKTPPKTR